MDVFHADSGELLLDGKKFTQKQHLIGYLPEERGLYPKKTVIEQLVYLGRLRGISKSVAINNSKKWLRRLEVDQYENRKLETLSKGNAQKVQLASTLVCDPDIVILDEPFSGLDPVNSKILQDVVQELIDSDKLVIFSSHQMSYVENFCKDIAIIDNGNIVLSGNLIEIKKKFGEKQLVLSPIDGNLEQLEQIIRTRLSDFIVPTGRTKEDIIIKCVKDISRKELLAQILECDIEIEHFETYKPSLNDIFVATVGDEENNIKQTKMTGGTV